MDIVVLAKYVADVEDVPPDAWDLETGTLKRGRLNMVTNPLDNHALRMAGDLRKRSGGRILLLSMGPESAENVCRRGIAYGADEAVLVTDRAFAGADTLATARVLASAVRKAEKTLGFRDPLILSGMQSPDGDTAQVPPELAAVLGVPLLPYVTAVESRDGLLEFGCLETTGHARYLLDKLPALGTVTSYTPALPFQTDLEGMLRASSARVHRWGAHDLGVSPEEVGLAGSATRVVNIESVSSRRNRRCTVTMANATEAARGIEDLVRSLDNWFRGTGEHRGAEGTGTPDPGSATVSSKPVSSGSHRRPVFSLIEEAADRPTVVSLELLGTARGLADSLGVPAVAVCLDTPPSSSKTLADAGAHVVLTVTAESSPPEYPPHHRRAHLLSEAVRKEMPQIVLAPASPGGRVVAPLSAASLGAGLTADCTGLSIGDYYEKKTDRHFPGVLHQTRPALGGNILATIVSIHGDPSAPQMATVRGGVFQRRFYRNDQADSRKLEVPPPAGLPGLRLVDAAHEAPAAQVSGEVPLTDSEIVVSVGIGIGSREKVDELVRPLIAAMERRWNLSVSLACSRAAVEAWILPYSYQIGQTGRTVRPDLYVAIGISGAIQHRLGMQGSGAVLAINPDPEAEIMAISDFAVLGTLEDSLPLLIQKLADLGQE
ncbi:MAG: FAD-binding protein [Spirochaetaceae bacterium]